MKKILKLIASAVAAAAVLAPVSAKPKAGRTVDQIKKNGTVRIAVFSDKKPFGYVDENGEYQG